MPAVCAGAAGWAAAIGVALALTIALVAWPPTRGRGPRSPTPRATR